MSKETIRIIALFKARPGKDQALKNFLTKLIKPTQEEKGCLRYELHQNTSDPLDFAFIEEWESHASIDHHLASPHIQAALPSIEEFVSAPPDIRRYGKCG